MAAGRGLSPLPRPDRSTTGTVEMVLVLVLRLLAGVVSDPLTVLAITVVAAADTALAVTDLAVSRLPDRLNLPAFVASALLLAADAIVHDRAAHALAALAGAAASTAVYLLLAAAGGGLGDVSLALSTGRSSAGTAGVGVPANVHSQVQLNVHSVVQMDDEVRGGESDAPTAYRPISRLSETYGEAAPGGRRCRVGQPS